MVAVLAEAILDAPCPRVGLTITELGIGESVYTVWRSADGERNAVSGYRRITGNDATFITDYHAPVGRPVTYEIEVLSGPAGASRTQSNTVTLDTGGEGYLMDPLVPQTCVPVVGKRDKNDDLYLRGSALAALEYNAEISIFKVMGSDKPMALFGQRMAEMNLDTSIGTRSAEQNTRLKKLLKSTGQLLFRPSPEWGQLDLPGAMFIGNAQATQVPVNVLMGGEITWWDMKSDVVQQPTIKVLTATFTYGDVALLMSTYQQKQDLMAGKTYLEDLKNPIG
ncbi:hypothetical protein PV761_03205 [Arthrobacter sp. CC3]|uniref:hypothetical protein n=1 Tax=Arthrobacter sp. CC3 TaxID=3029185 RepID=UPI003267B361